MLGFGKVWTTLKTPLIGIKGNTDSLAKTWNSESSVVKHTIKGAYRLLFIEKQLWKWVCFTSILDWYTESESVVETTQQFKTSLLYLIKMQFSQKLKPVSTGWNVASRKLGSCTLSSVDNRPLQWKSTSLLLCRQRGNPLLKVLNIHSEIESKTLVCQASTAEVSQNTIPSFAQVNNTLDPYTFCRNFFTNSDFYLTKIEKYLFTSPTFTTWWIENHLKDWMSLTLKLKTINFNLYVCIYIHTR